MAVYKKYYPLEEAAQRLGEEYKPTDLIHLGAQGELDIYVLADGWPAFLWDPNCLITSNTDSHMGEVSKENHILIGPYRLAQETLQKYEANPCTLIDRLPANGYEEYAPEEIQLEYRLCEPEDTSIPKPVSLANCKLVVMGRALDEFIAELGNNSSNEVPDIKAPTNHLPTKIKRKAPDAFVAALIKLLVEIAKRAAIAEKPFNVTAMPGIKADLKQVADKFDADLERELKTFDDYIAELCKFKQGAKTTSFYRELFPEFFSN